MTAEYAIKILDVYKDAFNKINESSFEEAEKRNAKLTLRKGMLNFFLDLNEELYGDDSYVKTYRPSFRIMDNVLDELDTMITELDHVL